MFWLRSASTRPDPPPSRQRRAAGRTSAPDQAQIYSNYRLFSAGRPQMGERTLRRLLIIGKIGRASCRDRVGAAEGAGAAGKMRRNAQRVATVAQVNRTAGLGGGVSGRREE